MDFPLMTLINAFIARLRITHVVICLYVDDMLIFRTSLLIVCETKKFLRSKFDMKYLGKAEVIIGIN